MNKAVYWVGSVALQSMLLATIIPLLSHEAGLQKDADHEFSTKTLTRDALVAGTRFFWCNMPSVSQYCNVTSLRNDRFAIGS